LPEAVARKGVGLNSIGEPDAESNPAKARNFDGLRPIYRLKSNDKWLWSEKPQSSAISAKGVRECANKCDAY
jgi:hypothetical protein